MLAQALYPQTIQPKELDEFLSNGWFRMGQSIFTTNFLSFNNKFYSAIWLRIELEKFLNSDSQKKLMNLNSKFKVKIEKASITDEKEQLFQNYKQGISFEASESLQYLLYGFYLQESIYNTYEIDIYHHDQLIAVGYFDIGSKTAQGITCFYEPAYKKYSLGKYLMHLKINFCKELGLQYFYPGYFAPGYNLFDYKLSLAKSCTEFLQLSTNTWLPTKEFNDAMVPILLMKHKLYQLMNAFVENGIASEIKYYRYFDAPLIEHISVQQLLDSPMFTYLVNFDDSNMMPLVIFNVISEKYQLVQCRSIWQSEVPMLESEIYSENLLQLVEVLFECENASELADFLKD